jgi:hypothetical protein
MMMKSRIDRIVVLVVISGCLAVVVHAQRHPNPTVWNSKIEIVATLPAPRNTENIGQGDDGSFYVTSIDDVILWKISPNGMVQKFFSDPSLAAFVGVATDKDDIVLGVFQRSYLRPGEGYHLDMSNVGSQVLILDKNGNRKSTIDGQEGQFFNGIARAGHGVFLITDENGMAVLRLDMAEKKIRPWIKDALLDHPNGIKVHNGWVYIGCRDKIYRVQMDSHLQPEGGPVLFAQGPETDDFAIAPDGTMYISSDTDMWKVSPTGEVSKFLDNAPNGPSAWVTKDGKWLYWPTRLGSGERKLVRVALK